MKPEIAFKKGILELLQVFTPLAVDTREGGLKLTSLVERSKALHLSRNKVVSPLSHFILEMAFALIAGQNRRHFDQALQSIGRPR